jgi:hypothetical protein
MRLLPQQLGYLGVPLLARNLSSGPAGFVC